ncbi:signal transduction histidine kinase [Sulfitobacter undariae]|uniref:histidine kinase n=1 Tax=Sulfitobacter undariae TaxID=1563671 RepID=A0A7W6H1L1_9RHOB|nr:ATP-binding protein [Sulfitobacter undariae]MBB3996016.1 signal transduction histidine kinase [Sulfitobacter undariae]
MQGITTKNLGKTQKEEDIVDQPNVQLQVDHNDQSWLVVWSNLERGGVFVFVQEITVAQENARRSSHVEKMEALGRISSGVAHEFNNMLGIIVANLDMAGQEGIDVDEARIFVTSATRAADRAASIVGQLKRMSKASDQAKDLVNLSQWAHIIRPMLSAAIGPQVDLNIECQEDLFITVDETFLDTAIVNLCKNASEAMGNHGRIDIRISPAREISLSQHPYLPNAEYCEISVSDKGPGIPEGISRKIFEPFFTGKPLTTGTGLGLSSVYSFVTAANGAVHLEDVRTGGAKFVLLFRKSSPPVPNAVTKGLAAPPLISLDGSRILLVEDELELASSYRHALENKGATVIVKSSIIEANEFLENDPNISLAIVDKTLPDGSGLDLASKIRFDIPKCKVILMSGNLTGHEEELVDVNMVLDKPFRLSVLASACAKLSSS